MARPAIFEWHAKEYASEEKSADWFWALGIVAVGLMIVSVLFNDVLLAVVIAAAAVTVSLAAAKRPRIHRFAVVENGIMVDNHLYEFENMLHFSVLEYVDPTILPALSIKTKHLLASHLLIPIADHDPVRIYEYISLHLPEGKHDESVIDRVIDMIRL
ncbi:MAG: hypothetical protein P4M11_02860 [Candidatus Pacebacteria bacterium]|nr:hypothetical protein [Candidatus Paceibacterota bacterium]